MAILTVRDNNGNIIEIPAIKGDPGKDGITPHIGDNGNWFIGDTDTGIPSRGEDAPQEAILYIPQDLTPEQQAQVRENIGAVAAPETAEVEQTIVVKEVDETGKPVAWEAADFPAGGGLKETVIFDITTTEPVNEFQIYVDDAEKIALLNSATMVCWRMTLAGDETATDTTGTGTAQLRFCGVTLLPSTSCVPSAENKGWFVGNANGFILRSGLIRSSLDIQSPNASKPNTQPLDLVISMVNNDAPKFYTANLLAYNVTGGRNDVLKLTTSLPIGTGSRIIVTAISE